LTPGHANGRLNLYESADPRPGLEELRAETGLPKFTLDDLRHTYGSHLAQSGLDPVGVQRQLGHPRPSITMDLYVHEFETARRHEQVGERLATALGGLIAE
jgi:integrase